MRDATTRHSRCTFIIMIVVYFVAVTISKCRHSCCSSDTIVFFSVIISIVLETTSSGFLPRTIIPLPAKWGNRDDAPKWHERCETTVALLAAHFIEVSLLLYTTNTYTYTYNHYYHVIIFWSTHCRTQHGCISHTPPPSTHHNNVGQTKERRGTICRR